MQSFYDLYEHIQLDKSLDQLDRDLTVLVEAGVTESDITEATIDVISHPASDVPHEILNEIFGKLGQKIRSALGGDKAPDWVRNWPRNRVETPYNSDPFNAAYADRRRTALDKLNRDIDARNEPKLQAARDLTSQKLAGNKETILKSKKRWERGQDQIKAEFLRAIRRIVDHAATKYGQVPEYGYLLDSFQKYLDLAINRFHIAFDFNQVADKYDMYHGVEKPQDAEDNYRYARDPEADAYARDYNRKRDLRQRSREPQIAAEKEARARSLGNLRPGSEFKPQFSTTPGHVRNKVKSPHPTFDLEPR